MARPNSPDSHWSSPFMALPSHLGRLSMDTKPTYALHMPGTEDDRQTIPLFCWDSLKIQVFFYWPRSSKNVNNWTVPSREATSNQCHQFLHISILSENEKFSLTGTRIIMVQWTDPFCPYSCPCRRGCRFRSHRPPLVQGDIVSQKPLC